MTFPAENLTSYRLSETDVSREMLDSSKASSYIRSVSSGAKPNMPTYCSFFALRLN